MNDIIKLLPDSVANQIAAGEVIQRPASVIKELVENSVDAGATKIEIVLKDAGRNLIQVIDNGCGMSETDARMAFERHATSKITNANDLYSLQTMGFRGEALASIAAVAQIEMRTMRGGDTLGTKIIVNGSQVESQEPVATTVGTNIQVKNLFYTVPARRRFLKKDSVELSAIMREFERLSLVNPDVAFTIYHNGQIVHQLMKASIKKRICDLFGKNLEKQLIPVETDTSVVRINGFIGLPANARKKNALQYLLINGRNMRHPVFHKAIIECYAELIPTDCQPNYFIYFSVDPATIDVNIHPTKNEIKFENEFGIRQILTAAVKESLGKHSAMPGIDFNVDDSPEIPVFNPNAFSPHAVELDEAYNPFKIESGYNDFTTASKSAIRSGDTRPMAATTVDSGFLNRDWQKLYDEFEKNRIVELGESNLTSGDNLGDSQIGAPEPPTLDLDVSDAMHTKIEAVQVANCYLVAPCRSGMMIVDQTRAHIRVLFDRYVKLLEQREMAIQRIMFPEILQLTSSQNIVLQSIIDDVAESGFDLSPLGDNSWSINGVPSVIGSAKASDIIEKMIEVAEEGGETAEVDTISKKVAFGMARAMAVKNGQKLNPDEINALISDLMKCSSPNFTPDGLTVIVIQNSDEINGRFNKFH